MSLANLKGRAGKAGRDDPLSQGHHPLREQSRHTRRWAAETLAQTAAVHRRARQQLDAENRKQREEYEKALAEYEKKYGKPEEKAGGCAGPVSRNIRCGASDDFPGRRIRRRSTRHPIRMRRLCKDRAIRSAATRPPALARRTARLRSCAVSNAARRMPSSARGAQRILQGTRFRRTPRAGLGRPGCKCAVPGLAGLLPPALRRLAHSGSSALRRRPPCAHEPVGIEIHCQPAAGTADRWRGPAHFSTGTFGTGRHRAGAVPSTACASRRQGFFS